MDKLRQGQDAAKGETLIERAVIRELKRLDLMRSVCSSHRTAGSTPVPAPEPKTRLQ